VTRFGPSRLGRLRNAPPTLLRIYLLAGAVLLAVALLLYFNSLARRLDTQTQAMSDLVAHSIALSTLTVEGEADSLSSRSQFREVIRALSFPVMITDSEGFPLAWNRIVGIDTLGIAEIVAEDLENPSPTMARVLAVRDDMDDEHTPIAMFAPGTNDTLMLLHYGSPFLAAELRWTPWITIGVAALFAFTSLLMIRSLKRAEESYIWAGMAKETAHQMGTPLSSLIGWLEVLREESATKGDEATIPRKLFEEVASEIERDTGRLNRVAARFSQIGSKPKLEQQSVEPIVNSTVDYFRKRFPEGVTLGLDTGEDVPEVMLNTVLFGWVLENLIKNAMNAVDKVNGEVRVRVAAGQGNQQVQIDVTDNGRGVVPGMEKQIFRPGVSTRLRGWGLGLPLSLRIVELYHGGRLDLVRSEVGKGASFRVTLPAARS
jgi:signal transduction histidine kinase